MAESLMSELLAFVERTWGFRSLRPLQERAMRAVLDRRDSLVVLPTGGGKSLCYQAPAAFLDGTTVVVSPLISLMKDQVDGLLANGVVAAQLDSSLTPNERNARELDVVRGRVKLLFVSPERLVHDGFRQLIRKANVRTFAVDEAHCISHWGHDFRPEYRQLQLLRQQFPDASFHAYTATATEQVRRDIVVQLGFREPDILVGDFDRPNLTYRVLQRRKMLDQVTDLLERHRGEAGIIYCIRRADVDELTLAVQARGFDARSYHAGHSAEQRATAQDDFINERCDLVVATVAFGMGIDRPNIRFVIHTGMPKSVEHYQQEAGRAGRDGLPAECVLLFSGADFILWKSIVEKSAQEAGAGEEFIRTSLAHLEHINGYARGMVCRHKALVEHFDQPFTREGCSACDVCLGEVKGEANATVIAQKILSCVARVNEGYGIGHVMAVLLGQADERIARLGHDRLSTFGLLRGTPQRQVRDWIGQLIAQKLVDQIGAEYPILKLNAASWEVMRSKREVSLSQSARPERQKRERTASTAPALEGPEGELFEALRRLRRQIAAESGVPPYVVFNDVTLREMARRRPATRDDMLNIIGVGEAKWRAFGERFLAAIQSAG